jgi:fructosamine-3-kinase
LEYSHLSGGCIHEALKLNTNQGAYFLKFNKSDDLEMFKTELHGLKLLYDTHMINIPQAIDCGIIDGKSFLLLEYLEASNQMPDFWEKFGSSLANLHSKYQQENYGLEYNNFIGRLPQNNSIHENWIEFFIENRLEVQIKLAFNNHLVGKDYLDRFARLYELLPDLLPQEPPSLLHGDLWSGNFLTAADGYAALIDPSIYYGNREIELAFTTMFGGFKHRFYEAYNEVFPVVPGFDNRIDIYNLYPYLVHVNLFGSSYLTGVDPVIRKYAM